MGVGENTADRVATDTATVATDTAAVATDTATVATDTAATTLAVEEATTLAVEELTTLAADTVVYPIAPGYRVNVRRGPGTQYGLVRTLPYGMSVPVYCQKPGERVSGPYGTSNLWDNIANGQFVSDAYVKTGSDGYIAPRCD